MKPRPTSHLQGSSLQVKRWLLVSLASLALIVFVYPSALLYPKDTLPDNNDTRLIAYIIGQVQKNLLGHKPLHYGTYFAPDQSTLAYSDLFLTSAILTLPFRLFTSHPILIFNLALVTGSLLTILCSFLLFEYLLKDTWTTTLAVILFNFSGFHLHYLPHLQMFSLWPLFLSLYFFQRYLAEDRPLFLNLFFFIVTIQLAESILPAYLIFFACLILLIATFKNAESAAEVPAKSRAERIRTRTRGTEVEHSFLRSSKRLHFISQILIISLPFIPFWIFLLYPYYHLHSSLPEAIRPIRDAAHFSLGLDQIFTQYHSWTVIITFATIIITSKIINADKREKSDGSQSRYPILKRLRNAKKHGFSIFKHHNEVMSEYKRKRSEASQIAIGYAERNEQALIFREFFAARQDGFAAGQRAVRFSKWIRTASDRSAWILILLFSITMSLGPVLKLFGQNIRIFGSPIPLPYALFYYLFPGFTGFRTPSRFITLALLAVCTIIGFKLKPIFEKLQSKTKLVFLLLVLSFLFWEADLPLKGYPMNINMHPVYLEVKNLPPEAVILELPIKLWNSPDHEIESVRSLYSLQHNHRRFGGFSGFATNSWIDLVEKINTSGLNAENTSKLKSLGVTHIIEKNQMTDFRNILSGLTTEN